MSSRSEVRPQRPPRGGGRPTCSRSVTIPEVEPGAVYRLVSDVTRTGEWSPQNVGGRWVSGATGPAVGARFVGANRNATSRWSTLGTVVAADPGRCFAFEVSARGFPVARWEYALEPTADGGTRLTLSWRDDRRGVRGHVVRLVGRHVFRVRTDVTAIAANLEASLAAIRSLLAR